ncbi:GNAT family N-acetyltransferase [Noviherbaspirillum cavernae]|nr:GNAT family N-acetyltransferase [Noviherbaspirillum cavernae]
MEFEIRTAVSEDAASVCKVLCRSISECCIEDHRNDGAILAAWLGNKTPGTVGTWLLAPDHYSLVAVADHEPVGVAMLTRAGKIVLCHVTPEVRFTGIGKSLLQAIEVQAGQWNLNELRVASTVTARDFYRRNGYRQIGKTTSVFGIETFTFSKRLCDSYQKRVVCKCAL